MDLRRTVQALRAVALTSLSDEELLGRFIGSREESAFAALLYRHGPMVLGVCQRITRQSQDAEDAFQATFLVLARRARSIRPRAAVGNWLYGVAYRTALAARSRAVRRHARERQVDELPDPPVEEGPHDPGVAQLLDDALSRLPDKYRLAVVLCELQGRSRKEVAEQLGIPEGTLSSRLAMARKLLARRLARLGVMLAGALACVPDALASSTSQVALQARMGDLVAGGLVRAEVISLMQEGLPAMRFTKHMFALGLLLALSLLGVDWFAYGRMPVERDNPATKGPATREAGKSIADQDKLQGTWRILDIIVDGQPARRQNPGDEADMVIKGNQMWLVALPGGKKVKEFRFQLDPSKMPKALDLIAPATAHGIYELDGDRLRFCFPQDANEAKDRPTAFKSEAGSRHVLMTLKRQMTK